MHQRLLEPWSIRYVLSKNVAYRQALNKSSILLPDGIALQWFAQSVTKHSYSNLNGTDFTPYLLDKLTSEHMSIHLWVFSVFDPHIWKTELEIEKAKVYIQQRRDIKHMYIFQSLYTQRDDAFDFDSYKDSLITNAADIRILLVCTGTPHQEVWTDAHQEFFKKYNILVINVWWLIDYWSWFETRAPAWIVKSRVLETPWRILQHPKKNAKKLWRMFGIWRYRWGSWFRKKES